MQRIPLTYGSLIDYENQKIKKTGLSTTVAERCSFMTCFGSCQFLRDHYRKNCSFAIFPSSGPMPISTLLKFLPLHHLPNTLIGQTGPLLDLTWPVLLLLPPCYNENFPELLLFCVFALSVALACLARCSMRTTATIKKLCTSYRPTHPPVSPLPRSHSADSTRCVYRLRVPPPIRDTHPGLRKSQE